MGHERTPALQQKSHRLTGIACRRRAERESRNNARSGNRPASSFASMARAQLGLLGPIVGQVSKLTLSQTNRVKLNFRRTRMKKTPALRPGFGQGCKSGLRAFQLNAQFKICPTQSKKHQREVGTC
jgi:hypothetical protein